MKKLLIFTITSLFLFSGTYNVFALPDNKPKTTPENPSANAIDTKVEEPEVTSEPIVELSFDRGGDVVGDIISAAGKGQPLGDCCKDSSITAKVRIAASLLAGQTVTVNFTKTGGAGTVVLGNPPGGNQIELDAGGNGTLDGFTINGTGLGDVITKARIPEVCTAYSEAVCIDEETIAVADEPKPRAEVNVPKKNDANKVGLGQLNLSVSLKRKIDSDCQGGGTVSDAIDDAKTDWNITGVDAKNVNNSTATWSAKAEGNATFNITIDDVGNPVNDIAIAGTPQTVTVVKPTGETTSKNAWGSGIDATMHFWRQQLTPTDVDFSGIQVTERDAGGGTDSCWFQGSSFNKFIAITGGTWTVGANNRWGNDTVGWFTTAVTYYRDQGQAPCSQTMPQAMDVVIPSGNVNYTNNNDLGSAIGVTTVSSTRDGLTEVKVWP